MVGLLHEPFPGHRWYPISFHCRSSWATSPYQVVNPSIATLKETTIKKKRTKTLNFIIKEFLTLFYGFLKTSKNSTYARGIAVITTCHVKPINRKEHFRGRKSKLCHKCGTSRAWKCHRPLFLLNFTHTSSCDKFLYECAGNRHSIHIFSHDPMSKWSSRRVKMSTSHLICKLPAFAFILACPWRLITSSYIQHARKCNNACLDLIREFFIQHSIS